MFHRNPIITILLFVGYILLDIHEVFMWFAGLAIKGAEACGYIGLRIEGR